MGTKATCTKCGTAKWVNTAKLHSMKEQLGIRPSAWLSKNYICRNCKDRISLIGKSQSDSIIGALEDFSRRCRRVAQGLYSGSGESRNKCKSAISDMLLKDGIVKYRFLFYGKTIVGTVVFIPIIGEYRIDFL